MMFRILVAVLTLLAVSVPGFSQAELQPLLEAQRSFEQATAEKGIKSAFLEFLRDDAIVFQPGPINGKQYWSAREADNSTLFVRNLTYSDVAANGLMGYTTGNWRSYQKGKSEGLAKFGQYVTIWERGGDGKFRASLDIAVSHEKLPFPETDKPVSQKQTRDINKRGWSPADSSMTFLRTSMRGAGLSGAYERFAADDVRLLRDGSPPIVGKKRVVAETSAYVAVDFPAKVTLFQAADMAYTWNPCLFDNSDEGFIKGNCLHIWKLRKKKWWIVLGVFAPVPNETQPVLKIRPKNRKSN